MAGNLRRPGNPVYYICWPKASHRGPEDKLTKHPKTVRIREDVLLGTLLEALSKLHFKLDQARPSARCVAASPLRDRATHRPCRP